MYVNIIYLSSDNLVASFLVDAAAGVWRSPSGHRELLHTNKFSLNSLPGYADGTSPSNWLAMIRELPDPDAFCGSP